MTKADEQEKQEKLENAVISAAMYWHTVAMNGGGAISPHLWAKAFYDLSSACSALAATRKWKLGKP